MEHLSPVGSGPEQLAEGLWSRLRDVVLAAEKMDTFAFGAEDGPARVSLTASQADSLSEDVVLRALRAAGGSATYPMLARACGEGATLTELAEAMGIGRLQVAERVSDLVQAGLVVRAFDQDRVQATQAGAVLADLVAEVASDLAARLLKARSDALPEASSGTPPKAAGDGLSLL